MKERRRPTLDEIALWLGVAVAALIVAASYAVSATSVFALLRAYGYARWQSFSGPLVADGPALYGMVRVVARSRRGVPGARYGWALVIAGTSVSVSANVAHGLAMRPGSVVAGCIAAAIPLAVLAMLEAIRGDAREVYRILQQRPRRDAAPEMPASAPAPAPRPAPALRPVTPPSPRALPGGFKRDRAAPILAARPEITDKQLAAELGCTERYARGLLADLRAAAPVPSLNGSSHSHGEGVNP